MQAKEYAITAEPPSASDPITQLERVAASFRASLDVGPGQNNTVSVFAIDALDRIGLPVVQAALIDAHGDSVIGYGYGATGIEAEVGALGELCEEVHCGRHARTEPRVHASEAELVRRFGRDGVVDPLTLCLPAGSDFDAHMKLHWVQATRHATGQTVLVPLDWLPAYASQIDETPSLITPITNGLGAGLDPEHAIAHGVMELLQRDGNAVSYRALDQGAAITFDTPLEPEIEALVERLRALGIGVTFKLACTDLGIANIYVVGDDCGTPLVPIQVTACGEAAHPDRNRALRKALLEFIGSRARKAATHGPIEALLQVMPPDYAERQIACAMVEPEEARALTGMAEWIGTDAEELRRRLSASVFAHRSDVAFSSLPSVAAAAVARSRDRLDLLSARLDEDGMDILTIDCLPHDRTHQVSVMKVIVPGLECETMSYRRIGWRGVRRLRARHDPLLLDAPTEGALRVRMREEDEERAGGPAWFDAGLADRLVQPIYPLYREPGPFSAQLYRQGKRSA